VNAILRAALEYVERDWRVLPVLPDKEPNRPLLKRTRGTTRWRGLREEPADATEVRTWLRLDPATGIGIITGDGLAVVDVDRPDDPDVPELPETATVSTPQAEHSHHYFATEENLFSRTFEWGELRSSGSYVVAPASVGENGRRYRWTRDRDLVVLDASLAEALHARAIESESVDVETHLCSLTTRTTKTESTGRFDYEALDRDETLVGALGAVLGLPDVPLERSFNCVLHRDRRASATLHRSEDGRILYHCFAGCGHRFPRAIGGWLSFPAVLAWQAGRRRRLGRVELVLWRLRLLEEAGLLEPVKIATPGITGISENAQVIFAGFLRLLALRWLTTPGKPTPFVPGFAGPWCGVGPRQVQEGFEELRRLGVVRSAGTDPRGLRLWLPEGVMPLED
jgi:Bifunctional DNA primase/polymerase, N-terminal